MTPLEALQQVPLPANTVLQSATVNGRKVHAIVASSETYSRPLIRVVQSPLGWPVNVEHYHADESSSATYPEQSQPRIDNGELLKVIVTGLLETPDTKSILELVG